MVRQAVRQAHGPEQSRRTHHPEPGRRVNHKSQYPMTKTHFHLPMRGGDRDLVLGATIESQFTALNFFPDNLDELVNIRSNVWIPAFAGMTVFVNIWNYMPFCHSRAGGNPGKPVNSTFYDTVNFGALWINFRLIF